MRAEGRFPRPALAAVVAGLCFLTCVGGWGDLGRALAVQSTSIREEPHVRRPGGGELMGRILAREDMFGLPTELTVLGDQLVLVDRHRDRAIVLVDRDSGKIVGSFGRPGDGPEEFRTPVSVTPDGATIAVLDAGLNRVTWLADDDGPLSLAGLTNIRGNSTVTGIARAPGGDFLVAGFMPDGRLARVNRHGDIVGFIGKPPDLDGLPSARRIEALQGTLRGSGSGGHFILTSRFASHIEIIDAPTMTETTIWGPERFQPHAGRYETRFGYLDSAPMKDGFFALYSGRTRDDFPGRANYGSTIHEFGWDGQLRAVYELDSDVISIAWSEEDGQLYAVRHDPVPGVVVYSLE